MAKKRETAPAELCLGEPRKGIRLFKKDENDIADLHRRIGHITGMSIVDIIRQCVRAGLPIVRRQLQPRRPEEAEAAIVDNEGS